MPDNPNSSTSIPAEKARALEQHPVNAGGDVVEQGCGYRITNFSASVRPQNDGNPESPWTVIYPPDQTAKIDKLV